MTAETSPKKPVMDDWAWEDLLAAIRKRRWSLRQIAKEEGYAHGNVLGEAKRRPYPAAERILAAYAGVAHPMEIWPSRYDADGAPNRTPGPKPMRGIPPVKKSTRRQRRKAATA
ncbi:MAG: helix-turn-helix domain-containing protein [Xanthomonadaceae bacterium]|nr:helix-turn-helix domain-containing protein [Xanthomonadaceae bacterium]